MQSERSATGVPGMKNAVLRRWIGIHGVVGILLYVYTTEASPSLPISIFYDL
jgi:predicted transcriptional regulator